MELLLKRRERPEWFAPGKEESRALAFWRSDAVKMDMAELAFGLSLVQVLFSADGRVLGYDEVIRLMERVFGVKLTNYRGFKRDFFKREEAAAFLKRMVAAIESAQDDYYR